MSDADTTPAVNADALSLRKPKQKSRVPSPLLEEEFAARFRIFDIIIIILAACWAVAFTLMIQTSPSHFGWLQGVMMSGLLGSWFGLPAYLLVRLGPIVYVVSDPILRQEVALTGMRPYDFLRGRLLPHLFRCGIAPLVLCTIPLLGTVFLNSGSSEHELVAAFCTVMFSIYFAILTFLFGFVAFAPKHGRSTLFAILRAIVYGLCIVGSIGVVVVAEDSEHWVTFLSYSLLALGSMLLYREWFREIAQGSSSTMSKGARSRFVREVSRVTVLSVLGTLVIDFFISSFAIPGLEALPGNGFKALHWLTLLLFAIGIILVTAVASWQFVGCLEESIENTSIKDAILLVWWLLLWHVVTLSPTLYWGPWEPLAIWNAMVSAIAPSAHLALVAVLAILITLTNRHQEKRYSILLQVAHVLILFSLVAAAAVLVRIPFGFLIPLAAHFAIMRLDDKPLLTRLATFVPLIFVVANIPVFFSLVKEQYDDWTLIYPYASIWPALAAVAWIFALRNYFRQDS